MIAPADAGQVEVPRFRKRVLFAMMVVVTAVAGAGLFFAQRNVAETAERELRRAFQGELSALHAAQRVRHAVLAERCRNLARNPRIGSALEEAKDLLYPSARDALADLMAKDDGGAPDEGLVLRARFYRFLDADGSVLSPPASRDGGALPRDEEIRLAQNKAVDRPQLGYLRRRGPAGGDTFLDEVMVMPIFSTANGEVIGALALGFAPVEARSGFGPTDMRAGIWSEGHFHLAGMTPDQRAEVSAEMTAQLARGGPETRSSDEGIRVHIGNVDHLLFYQRLNPDSVFPAAYEVCLYPLTASLAQQRRLAWQFGIGTAALLFAAYVASHFLSFRLTRPVEKLAVTSEENRAQRVRAEAALEMTHEELQRSARFSADASHQLKTPVTVLRAGLEELLAGEKVTTDTREEIAALVHQTFRLTSIIEDLLLLSRMDAGRLQLDLAPLDLVPLIGGWLDDLGALPDGQQVEIETDLPETLRIQGEKRYTSLILQNLLENARKYNRSGGRIRVAAQASGDTVTLAIGNTGPGIPAAAQTHIFERFHRGTAGENVPGHGLGLNLARELARLHGGELRLARSSDDWTEFTVRFRAVPPAAPTPTPTRP